MNLSKSHGLDTDELDGLKLEERKRQRIEAHLSGVQTHPTDITNKESTLSYNDCVETSITELAKLARQASPEP